uniref:Uncharacterized protein n=1 Tax=Vitrella brassicaformis TaxID=1169539 RepID=A0A7S1KB93_9ALVE|mmetsp:Transcript_4625/g.10733  ORF Transcript_4625/g.10733 Transcript_4625/m.10733 type:complete len:101 (+) Transcript_4625:324-626(+)
MWRWWRFVQAVPSTVPVVGKNCTRPSGSSSSLSYRKEVQHSKPKPPTTTHHPHNDPISKYLITTASLAEHNTTHAAPPHHTQPAVNRSGSQTDRERERES